MVRPRQLRRVHHDQLRSRQCRIRPQQPVPPQPQTNRGGGVHCERRYRDRRWKILPSERGNCPAEYRCTTHQPVRNVRKRMTGNCAGASPARGDSCRPARQNQLRDQGHQLQPYSFSAFHLRPSAWRRQDRPAIVKAWAICETCCSPADTPFRAARQRRSSDHRIDHACSLTA